MFKKLNKKILLLLMAAAVMTSGFSCKLLPAKQAAPALTKPIELAYWGVWDEPSFLQPLISDFQALHPNIKIKYTRFRFGEYEQKLLEAWAADRGPDLYSIPAGWLNKYQPFIAPQPAQIQLAFEQITKTLGKEEKSTAVRGVPTFSAADIKNKFADQVYADVVKGGQIYGLPLSLDSLALIYNRDLLDKAGVATPPADWEEVAEAAAKISQIDLNNNPVQAGIALGTADNINNAVDIVSVLMMQNGTIMADAKNKATFDKKTAGDYYPGLSALSFYTDFSDPLKQVYSWNNRQANSVDAFVSGKLAMTFGYTYQLREIRGRAPKINLGAAPLPQIKNSDKTINYTNYWVETVSHKAKNPDAAWGFLNFASSQEEVSKYLALAKKPSALRALINGQKEDPDIGVFAGQTLTAQTWYHGKDALKMEEIFKDLINNFAASPDQLKLLQNAAARINQTL